nr:hypothetical protein [Methylocella tundrae]
MIGSDGVPECLGANENELSFLVNAGAHQIGLSTYHGGRDDQIDGPQQFDKGLNLIPHAQ